MIDVTLHRIARMADMAFPAMSGMLGFVSFALNWVMIGLGRGNLMRGDLGFMWFWVNWGRRLKIGRVRFKK